VTRRRGPLCAIHLGQARSTHPHSHPHPVRHTRNHPGPRPHTLVCISVAQVRTRPRTPRCPPCAASTAPRDTQTAAHGSSPGARRLPAWWRSAAGATLRPRRPRPRRRHPPARRPLSSPHCPPPPPPPPSTGPARTRRTAADAPRGRVGRATRRAGVESHLMKRHLHRCAEQGFHRPAGRL